MLCIAVLFYLILCSYAYAADGVSVGFTLNTSITGPDGVCRKVLNNTLQSKSLFVPTKYTAEWQSFLGHPPSGVSITACAAACPAGKAPIPDEPGVCGTIMAVYSGNQVYGICGQNYADIGRCAYTPGTTADNSSGCYYNFQNHGTCIEGYDCPYDGWTDFYDSYIQSISQDCNNKTWNANSPGARCTPYEKPGDHNCLLTSPAAIPVITVPQCGDGIDNDSNGLIDTADTCACPTATKYVEQACPLGTTVICTELHRQGLLPDKWMEADARFGQSMPVIVMDGYHFWARPIVSLMQISPTATYIVSLMAQPWALQMAYMEGVEPSGSFVGAAEMIIGIPISGLVGVIITPFTWLAGFL